MEYHWKMNGIPLEDEWKIKGIYKWKINGISIEDQRKMHGRLMKKQWKINGR